MNTVHQWIEVAKEIFSLWPIKLLAILLFLYLLRKLSPLELLTSMRDLVKEFKDLFTGDFTAGAANALAIVVVLILSVLIIALSETQAYVEFFWAVGADELGKQFHESANPLAALFVMAVVALISVAITRIQK